MTHLKNIGARLEEALRTGTNHEVRMAYIEYLQSAKASRLKEARDLEREVREEIEKLPFERN